MRSLYSLHHLSQVTKRSPYFSVILLVVANITSLVLWTVRDPWQWERVVLQPEPPETYAKCTSDQEVVYLIVLAGFAVLAVVLASRRAWRNQQQTKQGSLVLRVVASHAQTLFVCGPLLAILHVTITDGLYVVRVLGVTLLAGMPLLVLVWPTLWRYDEREEEENAVANEGEEPINNSTMTNDSTCGGQDEA